MYYFTAHKLVCVSSLRQIVLLFICYSVDDGRRSESRKGELEKFWKLKLFCDRFSKRIQETIDAIIRCFYRYPAGLKSLTGRARLARTPESKVSAASFVLLPTRALEIWSSVMITASVNTQRKVSFANRANACSFPLMLSDLVRMPDLPHQWSGDSQQSSRH